MLCVTELSDPGGGSCSPSVSGWGCCSVGSGVVVMPTALPREPLVKLCSAAKVCPGPAGNLGGRGTMTRRIPGSSAGRRSRVGNRGCARPPTRALGVDEAAGIPAVEGLPCRSGDRGTGPFRCGQDLVDFRSFTDVVGQGHPAESVEP